MSNRNNFISLNGVLTDQQHATVPAVQSALFYGTGCFETLLMERQQLFRFDDHFKRLTRGLLYLGVPPGLHPKKNELLSEIKTVIKKNRLGEEKVRVRIQCSLNEQKGYRRDGEMKLSRMITCSLATKQTDSVRLVTVSTRVVPAECRPPDLKLSNMLHYRNAFREAADAGADDALMLTMDHFIAETSVANIFWKRGNTIYTPSAACNILPGIMRKTVIEIIQNNGELEIAEGKFHPEAVMNAEAAWLTNSIKEVLPVRSIDGKPFETDGEIFSVLRKKIREMKTGESS